MMTLYMVPGCKASSDIIDRLEELNLFFEAKHIGIQKNAEELIRRGGILQAPFLMDWQKGKGLYESEKILAYLEETYGSRVK